jgi:hypothetical protein
VACGLLKTSRAVDRVEIPPLPRFVVPFDRVADPPVGREAASYAWRPELEWASRLPLRRSEFEALRAIQAFLRERRADRPIVPTGERSLELFADEKRLDILRRNRRLFAPGRLSLDMLRTRAYAPPFAHRQVGTGPVALVLENVATYHSVLGALPERSPVGLVIFGAGGNFAASVCYLAELAAEHPAANITEIRYFGDLDRRGLEIPIAADVAARQAGLPRVRPAIGLWARLLRIGRRGSHPIVEPISADRLIQWLPASLRTSARDVLVSGARLAQEAVGTESLATDTAWATWAGLGPPGVERVADGQSERREPAVAVVGPTAQTGRTALEIDDAGESFVPCTDAEWSTWVDIKLTANWVLGDPILDWLQLHGERVGFLPDDRLPHYDPRTDFHRFVIGRAHAFKEAVLRLLQTRADLVRIASCDEDARSLEKARATVEALRAGTPIVTDAVLRNPSRHTFGIVDLLVRSDLLVSWFPELLSPEEAGRPASGLGLSRFHYRPIGIKFHTFELISDGHIATSTTQLAHAVQVCSHAEALGRVQGYRPSVAYLLGRTWQQGEYRGEGCFERLARVDGERRLVNRKTTLEQFGAEAVAWIRRLRASGADWHVLREPSVPELYPHARNSDDAPWHSAKREIANALGELTLLPGMNPERRAAAHASGIRRWSDHGISATRLGVTSPAHAARLDAVLAANCASSPPIVMPAKIESDATWREKAPIEFYVDFETVSNLDDDFSTLPSVGGQPLIVQIGCGYSTIDGTLRFAQWTVDSLTVDEERRIIDAWTGHMADACAEAKACLADTRICHWSAAEPVNLERAYNAARVRHPDAAWPSTLPWFDVLERVIRSAPVAVTGAFNFGLKAIAKAMHSAGLISTIWSDGPTDGLGAMAATWSAARESTAAKTRLSDHRLMQQIARYNEVDCRAMHEILAWLRTNR